MKLYRVVLTLSCLAYVMEAQQSQLMQSLRCSTDYQSYTSCTWQEEQEARDMVKMSLFHTDNLDRRNLTSVMCNSQKEGSQLHWNCRINQKIFIVHLKNMFVFKPESELEVQLNVSLFDNFQPPSPQKLGIHATSGKVLLAWEAGDGTNRSHWLDGVLDFQVIYKKDWEYWKNASFLWVSNATSCFLPHEKLDPGSTYVARVRSKLRQGSRLVGQYSDWSSEVTWKTPKDGKVEAQPKNLQCHFNGIDQLQCSWEIRKEVTSSLLFTLFYKENPGSVEKECAPVHTENVSVTPHYILQSCKINITNPNRQSQYRVTVRPKEEKKVMEAKKHIKLDPPYNLTVKVLNSQGYRLQWEARRQIVNMGMTWEISYWKTGKPDKAQSVNSSDQSFTFFPGLLEPNTHYTAKVRAKVTPPSYNGPWSQWSPEVEWTTESVFPPWVILLAAATSIILMMAGTWYGLKYLYSKKTKWESTIPSPPRTFLLAGFFQEVQLPDVSQELSGQCFLEDEGTDYANLSESQMLVGHLECLQVGSGKIIPHPIASQDMEKTELPCIAKANQFLTRANMGEQPVCTHHAQIFDFDGPYISCGSEPSPPEVQQDLDVADLDMKETAGFLQYVELPKCLQSQILPVGHEKGETHSFSFVSDQVQEEKKQLRSKRQQISQIQVVSGKLEKEENKPPSLPHTNSSCQTRPLDYIAVEDLSISKERDSSLSLPAGASKEGMPLICTKAAELPRPTEVCPSSGSCQEKSEPVVQATGHSLAAPSGSSQEAFDDNVLALPGKAESVPKERISLSVEEPKQDKGFLIFNPDGKKPVFLHQVGDYCFLPGSKAIREASKKPGETVRSQMLETNQKQAAEPLSDLPRWERVSTSINPSPGP